MPFLNIAVVVMVVLIAFLWATRGKGRGLFSAMLAAACTLTAGAIAFALWEPLVYGWLLGFNQEIAWCLGLVLPFAVSLLILRLIVDQTVRSNLDFSDTVNFIGGAFFGAISGVITAGIIVISISFLRFGPSVGGYQLVKDEKGNIVQSGSLWIPVDAITTSLYERLSLTSLDTASPLAERLPKAHLQAAASRLVEKIEQDGKKYMSRTAMAPGDFVIKGRYRVEGPSRDVLADVNNPQPQDVKYLDNSPPPADTALEGFVIAFSSGGAEKSGQFVVSAGQIRLVYAVGDEIRSAYPIAAIAQPEAGGGLYRFRFEAAGISIPSVGGQSSPVFAFEFVLPRGAEVKDLFIKNARADLSSVPPEKVLKLASIKKRDEGISDQSLYKAFGVSATSKVTNVDTTGSQVISSQPGAGAAASAIEVGTGMPEQLQLNAGDLTGLELNSDNAIVDGEKTLDAETVLKTRGLDQNLRVDKFATTRDTGIVKIVLAQAGAQSILGGAVQRAESILPPLLLDDQGNSYECIGFVYRDPKVVQIRFTPGRPVRGMTEVPTLSPSKRDQTLRLLFRPTKGAKIKSFVIGNKQLGAFDPPVEVR